MKSSPESILKVELKCSTTGPYFDAYISYHKKLLHYIPPSLKVLVCNILVCQIVVCDQIRLLHYKFLAC
jgi:hypothetical protein